MAEALGRWPLFHPASYVRNNPDLAGLAIPAARHFAEYGCWEGRTLAPQARMAGDLSSFGRPGPSHLPADPSDELLLRLDVGVYVSSEGNFFMRELASLLADGLRTLGVRVTEADETTPPGQRRRHSIVVAPHEFFLLGEGRRWATEPVITDCVLLSTEQPQTTWFAASLPYLFSARGVLDLCWQTSLSFAEAGLKSCFTMPGLPSTWLPHGTGNAIARRNTLVQSLPRAAFEDEAAAGTLQSRPLDVTFMASASAKRDDFLSRHLPALRDLRSVIIYRNVGGAPPKEYASGEALTLVNDFILRRSKAVLNIHRDGVGFFEIHRLGMQGIWNLCAVVTNPCLPHPCFTANEHYFEEVVDRIPKLLRWIINSPEGRREAETMRWAALQRYAEAGSARQQARQVAQFLGECFPDLCFPGPATA